MYAALAEAGTLTRKAFIEEMTSKHGMTPAGASTYYVNAKAKAEGKEVKSYYKSKSQRASTSPTGQTASEQIKDDVLENASMFSIAVIAAGVVESAHSFMSEASAIERFNKLKPANKEKCMLVVGSPKEGTPIADLTPLEVPAQQ